MYNPLLLLVTQSQF